MPTVLITGANRGIGLEFVKQYAADGWKVHACCRNPAKAGALKSLRSDIHIHELEVTDVAALKALAKTITEPLDVVIANAGAGGKDAGDFGAIDYDAFSGLLRVNTLGPIATLEAFTPNLKAAGGRFAAISSNLGSIENATGFAPAYSTSKAALNMAMKAYAAQLAPMGVAIAPFHPGWVRTDMGGSEAPTGAGESVSGLRREIARMKPTASPRMVDYAGVVLPW